MIKHSVYVWFQGAALGSLSDMDDLATTFAKVNHYFYPLFCYLRKLYGFLSFLFLTCSLL